MNPNAQEWKPTFSIPAPAPAPVAAPAPAPAPVPQAELKPAAAVPAPAPAASEEEEGGDEEEEEEMDENDPLWKAVFAIANNDKKEALKLLNNPDALLKYPEVVAIMNAQDSEAAEEEKKETEKQKQEEEAVEVLTKKVEKLAVAAPAPAAAAAAATAGDEEVVISDDVIQEIDARDHINIVFIGHVDAGKSTLSGSILYTMGKVDKRTIEKFEREAKQRNRESWFLAYILDESEEERAKGITIEVGRAHFDTDVYRYTILDAPGHKNYVPNMIAGAAQADIGVLVISARKGEFETGFEKGGQTREHALLAKTLGVQYLVVVINKMDDPTVEWDVNRYEECVGKLKPYLKSCGYVIKTGVKFLPIAGLLGDNILREVSAEKCPWWKNMYTTGAHNTNTPTLLSTLDSLRITGRNALAPLRLPCLDRYYDKGTIVMGKVDSGTISRGDEILIAPTKKKARVQAIYIDNKSVVSAKPGENVLLKFQINVEDIQKGYVLCSPTSVCPAVMLIKVQMVLVEMLEHRPVFSPGYDAVMHVHTVEIEVTCVELLSVLDKGKAIKRPFARQGQSCTAVLSLPVSTCMDTYANQPSMARFTIRDEGKSIAIGKIVEILK